MSGVGKSLENDLAWREAELASLRLLATQAEKGSVRQRALLRALLTMLYAHYEGFCKFAFELYVDKIHNSSPFMADLAKPIRNASLEPEIKRVRNIASDEFVEFASNFLNYCSATKFVPFDIETNSNLWCSTLEDIASKLAIGCTAVDINRTALNSLVGRRNEIAHGKKLTVDDIDTYDEFQNAAFDVMYELTLELSEASESRKYAV